MVSGINSNNNSYSPPSAYSSSDISQLEQQKHQLQVELQKLQMKTSFSSAASAEKNKAKMVIKRQIQMIDARIAQLQKKSSPELTSEDIFDDTNKNPRCAVQCFGQPGGVLDTYA